MNLVQNMFSKKWLLTTILVFIGAAVCVRLGIWQLDRLEQRRTFNAQVESMRAEPPLNLNDEIPLDIIAMEWRKVIVTGEYDFENQVALRNQVYDNQYGYHLITPLLFDPSTGSGQAGAVLVNRGWIPADSDWRLYDEVGEVIVQGLIRLGQSKPTIGGVADALPIDGTKLEVWNNLDVYKMSAQISYPILNIFIQPDVDENDTTPPIAYQPTITLTEGPHFEYAMQWFAFAIILFFGYPFYLRKQS